MVQQTLSQWVLLANGVANFLTGSDYSCDDVEPPRAGAGHQQVATDGRADGAVRGICTRGFTVYEPQSLNS